MLNELVVGFSFFPSEEMGTDKVKQLYLTVPWFSWVSHLGFTAQGSDHLTLNSGKWVGEV